MGKELKEYIIGKKHHAFRRDFPEYQNLAQEYHRLGLSPKERIIPDKRLYAIIASRPSTIIIT